jgi:hypothetical protein
MYITPKLLALVPISTLNYTVLFYGNLRQIVLIKSCGRATLKIVFHVKRHKIVLFGKPKALQDEVTL